MTPGTRDGGTPAESATGSAKGSPQAENPLKALDALAIELGRLAAQQDFSKVVEDKADTDLSFPQGRVPS